MEKQIDENHITTPTSLLLQSPKKPSRSFLLTLTSFINNFIPHGSVDIFIAVVILLSLWINKRALLVFSPCCRVCFHVVLQEKGTKIFELSAQFLRVERNYSRVSTLFKWPPTLLQYHYYCCCFFCSSLSISKSCGHTKQFTSDVSLYYCPFQSVFNSSFQVEFSTNAMLPVQCMNSHIQTRRIE